MKGRPAQLKTSRQNGKKRLLAMTMKTNSLLKTHQQKSRK
jgi:hypothetical protein